MAEHEYYEVNGRQIRVRPTESGQEIDEYGNFHRQPNHFTKGFGEGENPVEAILEIFIRLLQRDRMKKRGCFHMEERSFQKNKI